jgi:hypothetical protein
VVLLLVLLAACSKGGGGATAPTTVRTLPSTTTTTAPFAIPAVIDEAYVERVLNALNKIEGDAARVIVREQAVVPEAAAILRAVYLRAELNDQLRLWNDAIEKGLDALRDPPGDRRTAVHRVLSARPECIFVEVRDDYSAVLDAPQPPAPNFFALAPRSAEQDAAARNPTPWMISLDQVSSDGAPPVNPCAS